MYNFALVYLDDTSIVTMLWLIQVDLNIWRCIQRFSLYLVHKVKVWQTHTQKES